jgi:hypothetical protein
MVDDIWLVIYRLCNWQPIGLAFPIIYSDFVSIDQHYRFPKDSIYILNPDVILWNITLKFVNYIYASCSFGMQLYFWWSTLQISLETCNYSRVLDWNYTSIFTILSALEQFNSDFLLLNPSTLVVNGTNVIGLSLCQYNTIIAIYDALKSYYG